MKLLLALFLCLTALGLVGWQASVQAPQGPIAQPVAPAILIPDTGPATDLALHHPATPIAQPDGAVSDDTLKEAVSPRREVVREVVKQAYEQPLHYLMAAGPIWLSRYLTAVPWYGWSIIPALAYREWRQWPSDRWWDPLLDAAFLIFGVIGATWRGGPARSPALPPRWLRRGQQILVRAPSPGRPIRVIRPGS